jgi:excisionase family DNA binding protein
MDGAKLISVAEAAQRLGISPLTMRAWVRQRRLPVVRLGRRVLLDPQEVEEYIDAHRVAAVTIRDELRNA